MVSMQDKETNSKMGIDFGRKIKKLLALRFANVNIIIFYPDPDMQSNPIWKPKHMQETSKF